MNHAPLAVVDEGRVLSFGVEDLMRYHGPSAPGGVAHGFAVMARALPLLSPDGPPERRGISLATAFAGPGARDAVELVTRAVTEGRYVVDAALARPERGPTLESFVFRFAYRDRTATLAVREGFVPDELITLARAPERTAEQERRLTVLKQETADRVLAVPADQVYDVTD